MYRNKKKLIFMYLFPVVILLLVFVYTPIIMNFYYSLFRWSSFSPDKKFIGLNNFIRLFSDRVILIALKNNVYYAVISLIFQVGISMIIAAILEAKFMRKVQPVFRTIYYIPSMVSLAVVGLLWQIIFSPIFGLVNPLLNMLNIDYSTIDLLGSSKTAIFSVIAVSQWQYIGYTLVLFLVSMQKVPEELMEAGRIDGASAIQSFFHITIPQIKEIILVNTMITVIGAFKVFEEVYTMTGGGPGKSSQVLGTYLYSTGFRNDEMGYASAIAILIFTITLIFSIIQLKISKVGNE